MRNDRWKDGWGTRVAWSIAASAVLHALVLFGAPSWSTDPLPSELEPDPEMAWIALRQAPPPQSLPADMMAAAPRGVDPDSLPAAPEPGPADTAGEAELAGLSQGLRDRLRSRLRGRDGPVPSVVESEDEDPAEELAETSRDASTTVGGDPLTAEVREYLRDDSLDMDRLAEIQPELALVDASAWIRVRNPAAVARYMRRLYDAGRLDPGATGRVGLTLWISENGSVELAEVTDSSGRNDLDEIALALFNEVVTFAPARDEGRPVSAPAIFWVSFPWY